MKRLLSVFLCVLLMLSVVSVTAFAIKNIDPAVVSELEDKSAHAFIIRWRGGYYDSTGSQCPNVDETVSFSGEVTEHNIDGLILLAYGNRDHSIDLNRLPINDGYDVRAYSVSANYMQSMFFDTFGIDNVDFSIAQRYDAENEILFVPEGWGTGSQKAEILYENGQYVVRWYEIIDYTTWEYAKEPYQAITFNDDLKITGIYFPDLPKDTTTTPDTSEDATDEPDKFEGTAEENSFLKNLVEMMIDLFSMVVEWLKQLFN